jgi:hypothetical protein
MPDKMLLSGVSAVFGGLIGFLLARVAAHIQSRDGRREVAKALTLAGIPVYRALLENRKAFDVAAAEGKEQLRGYFLMVRAAVPINELNDYLGRSRNDLRLDHDLIALLRESADFLERASKKHEAIRSKIELSPEWLEERDTYRRMLVDATNKLYECLQRLTKAAPTDSRRAISQLPSSSGA